jgi:hypothetical protein
MREVNCPSLVFIDINVPTLFSVNVALLAFCGIKTGAVSKESWINTDCQSQSHFTTDGQSVSPSWCRAQSGAHDQIFILYESYCPVYMGRPLLTRGRVCHLSGSVRGLSFVIIYTLFTNQMTHVQYVQASASPGSVQQILPYF